MRELTKVIRTTRALWPYYLGITLCAVVSALTAIATPFIIKQATDTIVAISTDGAPLVISAMIWLAAAFLAVELLNVVVSNIGGYFGDVATVKQRSLLSTRYYRKLLSLSAKYYDATTSGALINRLTRSIQSVTDFTQNVSNTLFPMLLTVLATLGVTAYYSWPLALMMLAIYPTYVYLTTKTSSKWQKWEGEKNDHHDRAVSRFSETVSQIQVVKSFTQERRELKFFADRMASTIGITHKQSKYWHTMDTTRKTTIAIIFAAMYAWLFVQAATGHLSIGEMVLLLQMVSLAKSPAFLMSWLVDTSQRAVAGSKAYFEVLEADDTEQISGLDSVTDPGDTRGTDLATATSTTSMPSLCATMAGTDQRGGPVVEFRDVSFRYDADGPDVLRGVSFTIPAGHKVALVSESGGGKSTLVSLLLGLYEPTHGSITLCGVDISTLPLDQRRALVSVVFQDASLFSGSVRENISFGDPDADEKTLIRAAQEANAHDFVMKFADGYDTMIGERGMKLSGGQKQRIAIARAMLKDSPVLVLDEATSALDIKSERAVQAGLARLMTGRSSLVIAHRLATISEVDTIITLQQGRIHEMGAPHELASSGGIYAELLALQSSVHEADRNRLRTFGFDE